MKPLYTSLIIFFLLPSISAAVFAFEQSELENKTKKPFLQKNPGDRQGHDMQEVVPQELIPEAPILSPSEAIKTITVHSDFDLEVVASEPLIFDPVYVLYDSAGRLWAIEMTTFMPNTKGEGEMQHESQIVVLSDTNHDGKMDKRDVVIEKIVLPRALAFVDKGILWADMEKLYFSELDETAGDITVRKTEVVDPKYAKGGNVEHKPNGMLFSLDNWYYNARSNDRYRPVPHEFDVPVWAQEIYRNRHWKMLRSKVEYRGQWGISQDDWGRHYFGENFTPVQTSSFLGNSLTRNPNFKANTKLLAHPAGNASVKPIRVNPGINRGYNKEQYDEQFRLKEHTAACGTTIYRGDQYPEDFYFTAFRAEPAGNLVKATKLIDNAGVVSGNDLYADQEIVASTDERFRPVNFTNAPDGTINIVDFYHGIIQHRTFLTTYLSDQIKSRDLQRNTHNGRVYRLLHKKSKRQVPEYLAAKSALELVTFLSHSNGWHRDMAQQLLVMKQDLSVVEPLTRLAISSLDNKVKVKALWTLEGLGVVDFDTLVKVAKQSGDKVKRSIFRLVEFLPSENEQVIEWIAQQVKSASNETSPNLMLLTASHKMWPDLTLLINQFGLTDFALSGLVNNEQSYLDAASSDLSADYVTRISSLIQHTDQALPSLSQNAQLSFNRGEQLYTGKVACFGCHGKDGEGNVAVPPLNNSEWVMGKKQTLAKILLKGLEGPIEVKGVLYNSGMSMPGLGSNPIITDQDIADVMTYIRNAWSNKDEMVSDEIKAEFISKIRDEISHRNNPYKASGFNKTQ
jgi:putative membrane-bound dehydrogenase-like protein